MIASSARLQLRYYRHEDVEPIFRSYTSDTRSARYLARRPHSAMAQTQTMLQRFSCQESAALTGKCIWVIHAVDQRTPVGLLTVVKDNASIIIHFGIGVPFRGCGYATEALALAARHLLAEEPVSKLCSFTDTENSAAQAALLKSGFVFARRIEQYYRAPQLSGVCRDVFYYNFRAKMAHG